MADLTRFAAKKLLDHLMGQTDYPFSTERWLALFTDDPGLDNDQTSEITGQPGYARVDIVAAMGETDLASSTIANEGTVTVGPPDGVDWPEIAFVCVMDAETAGNALVRIPAVTSRVVEDGDPFLIKIGQLTITLR